MQHVSSKSQQFCNKGLEWYWSECNLKNDKNDQRTMIRMIIKIKEDMYKHFDNLKINSWMT
jgi:hypothetical protein